MIAFLNKYKSFLIILSFFIFIYLFLNYFVYFGSQIECGQVNRIGISKGARYLVLEFEIDNKKYNCSQTNSDFKPIDIDSLKKIKCIKIEYSTLIPFFNRVVDKQVLK